MIEPEGGELGSTIPLPCRISPHFRNKRNSPLDTAYLGSHISAAAKCEQIRVFISNNTAALGHPRQPPLVLPAPTFLSPERSSHQAFTCGGVEWWFGEGRQVMKLLPEKWWRHEHLLQMHAQAQAVPAGCLSGNKTFKRLFPPSLHFKSFTISVLPSHAHIFSHFISKSTPSLVDHSSFRIR